MTFYNFSKFSNSTSNPGDSLQYRGKCRPVGLGSGSQSILNIPYQSSQTNYYPNSSREGFVYSKIYQNPIGPCKSQILPYYQPPFGQKCTYAASPSSRPYNYQRTVYNQFPLHCKSIYSNPYYHQGSICTNNCRNQTINYTEPLSNCEDDIVPYCYQGPLCTGSCNNLISPCCSRKSFSSRSYFPLQTGGISSCDNRIPIYSECPSRCKHTYLIPDCRQESIPINDCDSQINNCSEPSFSCKSTYSGPCCRQGSISVFPCNNQKSAYFGDSADQGCIYISNPCDHIDNFEGSSGHILYPCNTECTTPHYICQQRNPQCDVYIHPNCN